MIPFNDFQRQWRDTRQDTLDAVEAVGSSGWYILGSEVRQFEAELAALWGVSYAVGVASGLDAIEIALRSLGCTPGRKVLTTPLSAFATTLAILKIGAVPVFVDCDGFGLIDLEACEDAVRHDAAIRFLTPVHLYGHSLDLGKLRRLREEYGLSIVEDCAQSVLAGFRGAGTGTAGQCGATSFYPTKNLGAMGDGGAILTNDADLAERARGLRDYGQSAKYRHDQIGYNSRLDELQAAILRRAHLPRLQDWTRRRVQIAEAYTAGIQHPAITAPGAPEGCSSCRHLFSVLIEPEGKAGFMAHMREQGVTVAEHYPVAIPDQPALRNARYEMIGDCAQARRICASQVSLPIHPYLRDEEIAAVIAACNGWK